MIANEFYERHLKLIQVTDDEIRSARNKRDQLASEAVSALRALGFRQVRSFRAGALAAGLQIKPLNDVDLVVEADGRQLPESWSRNPATALSTLRRELSERTGYQCEPSAHAVKVKFPDEDFTADVVFGVTRQGGGLYIPHCPENEPHDWIDTDPETHAELIRQRNAATGQQFARAVRIAKSLNRYWAVQSSSGKKPVSSFHLVAMAWHRVKGAGALSQDVADVFNACSELVLGSTPDPSGLGDDLVARDPAAAHEKFRHAAQVARQAVTAGDQAGALLEGLFGDQKTVTSIFNGDQLGYTRDARLTTALGAGTTPLAQFPSHGDPSR